MLNFFKRNKKWIIGVSILVIFYALASLSYFLDKWKIFGTTVFIYTIGIFFAAIILYTIYLIAIRIINRKDTQ